jgi:DHA2 family multidrug resistance protein
MPTDLPAAPAPDATNRGLITICVMFATVMQALDTTIANVALPYMQGSLSATQDQINWVLTSYIVAAAIMTPVTGFLAAKLGRKALFLTAVIGFTVASVLCGIAQSLTEIVVFRLAQGVFGAPLVPLSQAVLLDSYPKEKQGQAMAMWGVGVMVGPILGPTLGGWLTESYNWRWVFYINVPIGIAVAIGLSTFLKDTPKLKLRFDWFGFSTFAIAIGAFQLFLDRGEQMDWFGSLEIIAEATIAAFAAWLFIVHTFTADEPFIDPKLFHDRNFSTGVFFIFIVGIILLATLALLTPFLQTLMNYPVFTAGLVLAPRGVGTMLAMLVAGRLIGKVDVRIMLVTGLSLTAYVLWQQTGWTPDVAQRTMVVSGVLQGIGLGLMFVPLSTITFSTLAPQFRTQATGLFSLMRNLGSSIGISYVTFMLVRNTQVAHADLAANATPLNPALHGIATSRFWNLDTLAGRAALDAEITRQATIISYINDFKLMMIVALCAIPFVLLLRPGDKAAEGHAVLE